MECGAYPVTSHTKESKNLNRRVITTGELNELCLEVPVNAPRSVIWARVLNLLMRHDTGRVQVIMRFPDTLEVVAASRDATGPDAILYDRDALRECFQDSQARFLPSSDDGGKEAGRVALLPMLERGEVTAVLRVEHPESLSAGEVESLKMLAFSISSCLTERAWVLGRVIEVVSGKPLDEFLHERIFEPLGMFDTGFFVPDEKHGCIAQPPLDLETGELAAIPDVTARPDFISGGSGLVSTAGD